MDGGVAQPQGNLTDGIAVFQQHLTASLQLFIIDVLFRGLVDGILEHQLQRRPRQRKVFADFRDRQRKVDVFINIGDDPSNSSSIALLCTELLDWFIGEA